MHAGRAVQRGDANSRIVGQRRQLRMRARMPRLGKRVLNERNVWFGHFRDAQIRLRYHFDSLREEQAAKFAQLARIARGKNESGKQAAYREDG